MPVLSPQVRYEGGYGPFAGRDYGLRYNRNFDPRLTIDVSA